MAKSVMKAKVSQINSQRQRLDPTAPRKTPAGQRFSAQLFFVVRDNLC
jgi:hypothetical protein